MIKNNAIVIIITYVQD